MTPRQRRIHARRGRNQSEVFWQVFPVIAFTVGVVIGTFRGTQPDPLLSELNFESTVEYGELSSDPIEVAMAYSPVADF